MTGLWSRLPRELVEHILSLTDPQTVSAFCQTTRTCRSYIELGKNHLWRSLFKQYFDEDQQIDWKDDVHIRTRARLIANASSPVSPDDVESAITTLVDVAKTAHPGTAHSNNVTWLNEHIPIKFITGEHLSASRAQLQVLRCEGQISTASRVVSQSYIYDTHNYKLTSLYGPFLPPTRRRRVRQPLKINYTHLWHLVNAQLNSLHHDEEGQFTPPRGFNSTRAMSAPPSTVDGDWAGVEGDWKRLGCWVPYDLLEGTHPPSSHYPTVTHVFFLRLQRTSH